MGDAMAKSPLRPLRLTFVFGKGLQKRRRESNDPTRFIAEQVMVEVLNDNWDDFKADLGDQIAGDVRQELNHLASQFRYHVVGLSNRQKRPSGMLTTAAKGADRPERSLSQAYGQDWIPRSAKYIKYKKGIVGHTKWFLFDGYLQSKFKGQYVQGASTDAVGRGSGGEFTPGGGIFEDLFGPVSVQILRNKKNWGLNAGGNVSNKMGARSKVRVHLATIRVRALGSVTDAMLKIGGGYNAGLMNLIRRKDAKLADRLGGRYHYRPTLEPFLEFFLQRALPHAVSERIRKGTLGTSIIRTTQR
jgi:hypothetical protein